MSAYPLLQLALMQLSSKAFLPCTLETSLLHSVPDRKDRIYLFTYRPCKALML